MKARDIMTSEVHVVAPGLALGALERKLIETSVSGFPVVDAEQLVGIVTRSDVVRAFCVEQSLSETVTYLHKVYTDEEENISQDAADVAERVSERLEHFRVKDIMTSKVISVSPEASLREIAQVLVKNDIHRVPVVEEGQLMGIISMLDLTQLFADGRAVVS